MKVLFPNQQGRYYRELHTYVLNVFRANNCDITFSNSLHIEDCVFKCVIEDKEIIFDLSDFDHIFYKVTAPVLKRTYRRIERNIYPMGPLQGLFSGPEDTSTYKDLLALRDKDIKWTKDEIYFSQRAYGAATEKRQNLRKYLNLPEVFVPQKNYLRTALEYRYNVFLPGANSYVLDRAPTELMFLGATILHPPIDIYFPYFQQLKPNMHYIPISDTGLDCREKAIIDTGHRAKDFFSCMTPENLLQWWCRI